MSGRPTRIFASLFLTLCGMAAAQQLTPVPPNPTETPSRPFFITKTWIIGGVGDWDYLTVEPVANKLFIAHGQFVQVVDVESGTVAGIVKGLRQAHAIVLDHDGAHGYVTDGPANMVRVFDRTSFEVVASIPTGPSPRSMALDPVSGLLFVVGAPVFSGGNQAGSGSRTPSSQQSNRPIPRPAGGHTASTITVIDAQRRTPLAQILLPGALGFAQADGDGRVYITVADRNQILRLDAQAMGNAVHRAVDAHTQGTQPVTPAPDSKPVLLDWSPGASPAPPADAYPSTFRLDSSCQEPRALAFDAAHGRLFAACSNFRLAVLNASTGQTVAVLPIGPGEDAIAYDPNRGMIYSANGGGDGSLTIIQQDVTDTYAVVETLPTRQNARTIAVNPSDGSVYLVTIISGAKLNSQPVSGANLTVGPIDASFEVLVVAN
jgi:DNA-binding beta-propeller fold protein YncE